MHRPHWITYARDLKIWLPIGLGVEPSEGLFSIKICLVFIGNLVKQKHILILVLITNTYDGSVNIL